MVEAITKTINKFGELLTDICKGDEEDEVYLIEETEIYCASSTTLVLYFHVILQGLYKLEVLQGKTILSWSVKAKETIKDQSQIQHKDDDDEVLNVVGVEKRKKFLSAMDKFLLFLKEKGQSSEEESEEEESEESSSSSNDSSSD